MAFPAIAAILGQLGGGSLAGGATAGAAGATGAATASTTQMTGAMTQLSGAMKPATFNTNELTGAITGLSAKLSAPIAAVKAFGDSLGHFTQLSNPGQFAVFTRVMTDAFAALGKGLEPLMGFAITVGQFVGDTFAKLEPIITTVSKIIADIGGVFLSVFGGIFKTVFEALTPVFEVFIAIANQIAPAFFAMNPAILAIMGVMRLFAESLLLITWPLRMAVKALQELGLMARSINPNASAKGMAAQNFSVSTSADEFQRSMATSALSSNGPATAEQAMVQMPGILQNIYKILGEFFADLPGAMKDALLAFVEAIVQGIKNAAKAPFQAGQDAAQGLLDSIRGLGIT
jgi:hypothetical protein